MFVHDPACEACNNEAATAFALIENDSGEPQWKFCGACTADSDREQYYMQFEGFFRSPSATVDWFAHMHEKGSMNWDDFMDMMKRFRTATHSYGSLSQ